MLGKVGHGTFKRKDWHQWPPWVFFLRRISSYWKNSYCICHPLCPHPYEQWEHLRALHILPIAAKSALTDAVAWWKLYVFVLRAVSPAPSWTSSGNNIFSQVYVLSIVWWTRSLWACSSMQKYVCLMDYEWCVQKQMSHNPVIPSRLLGFGWSMPSSLVQASFFRPQFCFQQSYTTGWWKNRLLG